MANLGRVQGASIFHTMAASGTSVAVSSLQPQGFTPFVGDAVQFPNGDVRQITAVSGSTVTLGGVLFSYKGDAGIGNATLSNTDGDSTENGFTQAAVKGIAQAKNYYNLNAFDTYVSNGDGTGAVGRNTGIVDLSKLNWSYNSTEDRWSAGFDIVNEAPSKATKYKTSKDYYSSIPLDTLTTQWDGWSGSPHLIVNTKDRPTGYLQYELAPEYQREERVIENQPINTLNQAQEQQLRTEIEGKNGAVVHSDNNLYLSLSATSPAQTIGGDWEDLGSVTVGSTTLHAYQKVSGGN